MSAQILATASENILKLFDLINRIDERVKMIQENHTELEEQLGEINERQVEMLQKIAVLESQRRDEGADAELQNRKLRELELTLGGFDKRLAAVEGAHGTRKERWNKVVSFALQLVWVVIAAYILTRLHLQAPSVP